MTLGTCQTWINIAKKRGDKELEKFWQERYDKKLALPQYAHKRPKEEVVVESKKPAKTSKS